MKNLWSVCLGRHPLNVSIYPYFYDTYVCMQYFAIIRAAQRANVKPATKIRKCESSPFLRVTIFHSMHANYIRSASVYVHERLTRSPHDATSSIDSRLC